MQAYRVGGSVRDELLGLPVVDRDWVVVGATPEEMVALGFRPVGKDFPVFLHPETQEEYALARTERKTGPGYKGFTVHYAPGVTLEEDLARRDLTINAIAQAEDGRITDPFNGRRDLDDRVLRHVGDAFTEDPVRILRLARFAARFTDFGVAPETMALMQRMTAAGEVDALVAERVWQELSRGLQEAKPSRMIGVLEQAGALAVLLPELGHSGVDDGDDGNYNGRPRWPDWLAALDRSAARNETLPVSYAVLLTRATPSQATSPEGVESAGVKADEAVLEISARLRAPTECRDLAALLARESRSDLTKGAGNLLTALIDLTPAALLQLLERCDAWRRPERVAGLIAAAAALNDVDPTTNEGAARLRRALTITGSIDQGAIARRHPGQPEAIREAIQQERLRVIEADPPPAAAPASQKPVG